MDGEWWYDWYDEGGGGFRWLLARNGITQALSSPVYTTRLDAVQAAEDFSRSISHITFSVAPVDAWFWSWIATFRGALLAGSGAYPSVEVAQEAATNVEAHARMARPLRSRR